MKFKTPGERRRQAKIRKSEIEYAIRDRAGIHPAVARFHKLYFLYRSLVKLHVSPVLFASIQEQVEHEGVKAGIISVEDCLVRVEEEVRHG